MAESELPPDDSEDEQHQPEETHDASEFPEEGISRLQFSQLSSKEPEPGEKNVDRFDDVPLLISIELGRINLPIREILDLKEGSIVETKKPSGQPMEIMVNDRLFGRGEVVVVGDNLAIRITDLIKPDLT